METTASILVVDDKVETLNGIQAFLEPEGFRVLTAGDGFEALSVLQSEPVSLIVSDIVMPRMNGYELYERVRERLEWVAIPFIFLTVRTMDSDWRYGTGLGVDDYLPKPFEAEDLLSIVRGKLLRAQQLAQARKPGRGTRGPGSAATAQGSLRVQAESRLAWLGSKPIRLSVKECKLLSYLCARPGQVSTAQELAWIVHGLDASHKRAGETVRPLVRSLRRKLGYPAGEAGCIENVRGLGYLFRSTEA